MPNHIHFILQLNGNNGTGNPSPTATVPAIVAWFKYQTTKQINAMQNSRGRRIFQRSYYDRLIRNEKEYREIWEYIYTNPQNRQDDCIMFKGEIAI